MLMLYFLIAMEKQNTYNHYIMKNFFKNGTAFLIAVAFFMQSCESAQEKIEKETFATEKSNMSDAALDSNEFEAFEVNNYSVTPPLVIKQPGFEKLKVASLISSADELRDSPEFVFGGSADGSGLLKEGKGYALIVNHEDNFAVSRVILNGKFQPIRGEYIMNSDGGQWRLCSATLATPEEHGFGPAFITCGESGPESRTHSLNPYAPAGNAEASRELPGFGRWSAENAVPLPKDAYAGYTAVVIGDDDSGNGGGQVALYLGKQGDLDNGRLFMLRRTDLNQIERDMVVGDTYDVEFTRIKDQESLTGDQINLLVDEKKAIKFGRVEDIDYRKGGGENSREIYFNVTGQDNSGANADYSRTKYGRVYRLVLNEKNPLKGTLSVVLDGDDRSGIAGKFQNPDNICVTDNYAYIQEDPNGYGDETHDAYVYQYNLRTGVLKVVFELDHLRNGEEDEFGFNGAEARFGSWEYGSLVDISDVVGKEDVFYLCIQPHTWRKEVFAGVDGGSKRLSENQGSQIILIKGLAR